MKKITFLILLLSFLSCKKEEVKPQPQPEIIGMRLILQPAFGDTLKNVEITYPDGSLVKKYPILTVGVIDSVYAIAGKYYNIDAECKGQSYVYLHLFYFDIRGKLQMINSDSTGIHSKIMLK